MTIAEFAQAQLDLLSKQISFKDYLPTIWLFVGDELHVSVFLDDVTENLDEHVMRWASEQTGPDDELFVSLRVGEHSLKVIHRHRELFEELEVEVPVTSRERKGVLGRLIAKLLSFRT